MARFTLPRLALCGAMTALFLGGAGCGDSDLDRTPEKLDGSSSQEFEADDIERAESASEAVQDYCGDIESEAQRIGCLSHVDESEIP